MHGQYNETSVEHVKAAQNSDSVIVVAQVRTALDLAPGDFVDLEDAIRQAIEDLIKVWSL